MGDNEIVELYINRDERAIEATKDKYERYCYSIAYNILGDAGDSEECVNDTYLGAWNSIPPNRPQVLGAFLGRITRNVSLNKRRYLSAKKRDCEVLSALDELQQCIAGCENVERDVEEKELSKVIDDFLRKLPEFDRKVFVCRYWYMDSIADICNQFNCKESKIKMRLKRVRDKLCERLKKEGEDL